MSGRRLAFVAVAVLSALAAVPPTGAARSTPALPPALSPDERARIDPVVNAASVTTRAEGVGFVGRPAVFEFLLDHPEFATHVTRTLRTARYRIWRAGDGLALDDGWGTVGTFEVVHASPGTRAMYARGEYHQRVLPSIRGQAVVVLEYRVAPAADGRTLIVPAVSGYVKLDSRLLALAGRVLGAIAEAKADKEAQRLMKVFARTTQAIEADPAGVYAELRQRPDVPAGDLAAFRDLLNLP